MKNSSPNQLIAPRYVTTLKYCDRQALTTIGAGFGSAYLFNLNSIYDPDRTGAGHQPLGRDQLALLYSRYRVFAVSYKVTFLQQPLLNTGTMFVVPVNNATSLSGYSLSIIKETPYVKTQIGRNDTPTVIKGRVNLPKLTGQTPSQYKAGLEYQAQFNADPTELMTLQVGGIPFTTSSAYVFDIELIYHVECFDPIPLIQS